MERIQYLRNQALLPYVTPVEFYYRFFKCFCGCEKQDKFEKYGAQFLTEIENEAKIMPE